MLVIWAFPYGCGLAACVHGRNSVKAERRSGDSALPLAVRQEAEERRYSSRQNAVGFGMIALATSALFMIVENEVRN
jgi:hypothetical protein